MEPGDQEGFGEKRLLIKEDDELKEQDSHRTCLHTGLGYAAALGVVASSSISTMCAQALGGLLPPFELNGWRYVAQLIIVAPILIVKRVSIFPERQDFIWLVLAGIASAAYNGFYYTAVTYLPVGTVGGVGPSSALLLIALVAAVLDRNCALRLFIACTMCVVGTLLVTQPSFLFRESGPVVYNPLCGPLSREGCEVFVDNSSVMLKTTHGINASSNCSSELKNQGSDVAIGMGYLCILGSGVSLCILYSVIGRKLSHVNGFVVCFWVSIVGIFSQFLLMSAVEIPVFPKTTICIGLLLGHCFLAGGGTNFMIMANQLIPATIVSLVFSFQVVILFIAQYTALKHVYPGNGNWLEVLGAVLVFLANITSLSDKIYELVRQSDKTFH